MTEIAVARSQPPSDLVCHRLERRRAKPRHCVPLMFAKVSKKKIAAALMLRNLYEVIVADIPNLRERVFLYEITI